MSSSFSIKEKIEAFHKIAFLLYGLVFIIWYG